MNRVVISGIGMMVPSGFGEEAARSSVLAGVHQFRPITRFDTSPFRAGIAAESAFTGSLLELGLRLAADALTSAGLADLSSSALVLGIQGDYNGLQHYWRERIDMGTPQVAAGQAATAASSSRSAAWESESEGAEPEGGRPERLQSEHMATGAVPAVEFLPAFHMQTIAERYGMSPLGTRLCLNNACIASSNAIGVAYELIRQGRANRVLCGGYSLVTEEMFAKFDSGRAFAKDGRVRAFSANRSGMLLGDGGAMLVLESLEQAVRRGATIHAELLGWGLSCDAFHVCQPHPHGAGMALAIERALQASGLPADQIDYIHAHGTGTPLNDRSETAAIKQALGAAAYRTPVSSTKTVTGHLLEGTGALETALSVLAMKEGILPPTVGFEQPDESCDLDYVPNEPRSARLRRVVNLNASFGGNNTALVLQHPEEVAR